MRRPPHSANGRPAGLLPHDVVREAIGTHLPAVARELRLPEAHLRKWWLAPPQETGDGNNGRPSPVQRTDDLIVACLRVGQDPVKATLPARWLYRHVEHVVDAAPSVLRLIGAMTQAAAQVQTLVALAFADDELDADEAAAILSALDQADHVSRCTRETIRIAMAA